MRELSQLGHYDPYGERHRYRPVEAAASNGSRRFQAIVLVLFWACAMVLVWGRVTYLNQVTPAAGASSELGQASESTLPQRFGITLQR